MELHHGDDHVARVAEIEERDDIPPLQRLLHFRQNIVRVHQHIVLVIVLRQERFSLRVVRIHRAEFDLLAGQYLAQDVENEDSAGTRHAEAEDQHD